MFPNISMPQLNNNRMGGTSSAIMHLFSPRLFSNQAKRPIAYKFDPHFTDAALDAIAHKTSTQNGLKIDALTRNPNFMGAMVPAFNPDYMLDMSNLAYYWTFILLVNNDKTGPGGITRAMSDNLQLYYGYFLDEPINPLQHLGRMTFNENSALIVTHKTIVNKSNYVSALGQGTRIDTMADIDIIQPLTMSTLSDRQTVLMTPEDLYQKVDANLNGDVVVMHDEGKLLSNLESTVNVHAKLAVPKNNIKKVLDGIADAQSSIQSNAFEGVLINIGQDAFRSVLGQNLRDTSRELEMGLSTNTIILLGRVMQQYNPSIHRWDVERVQPYDAQDQTVSSARIAFSSMLSTILPAIMADYVLAQFSFRYNSYADAFEVYVAVPITNMGPEDLKNRVNSLIFRLKSEIFPILKMRDDFELRMNCDCFSVTHVDLNFFSDTQKTNSIFEVPTLLGGFNSPLVGSSSMADKNAKELGFLVAEIHETDRDVPLGHYDVASYNRALITHDNNTMGNMNNIPIIKMPENNQPPIKDWQF